MLQNNSTIAIQCVYGPDDVRHIETVLIPSLASATHRHVTLNVICYAGVGAPKLVSVIESVAVNNVEPHWTVPQGFGACHNFLFQKTKPDPFFILINPDCIAVDHSIDNLIRTYTDTPRAGIVEGRQWPYDHPKEYDLQSHETPWASGAYCLVGSTPFEQAGGFDERYFLYNEDVDLSWRFWLGGWSVLFEPGAPVVHFSGQRHYRSDIVSREGYYSIRNFIYISYKFFGDRGLKRALELVSASEDKALAAQVIVAARSLIEGTKPLSYQPHPQVKIHGINRFHDVR